MNDWEDDQCEFVSPRGRIRCELDTGHDGKHRAWDENGIPTLAMDAAVRKMEEV